MENYSWFNKTFYGSGNGLQERTDYLLISKTELVAHGM